MATQAEPPSALIVRRHPARVAAKWAGIVLLGIFGLVIALLLWLNTDPGRSFIVRQINNFEAASGLQVHVGRIEGSVFGELTLHDLALSDPRGVFLRAPTADLAYRPLAYFRNHIDIRSLIIPQARIHRLPELRAGDPDAPLLPDIDIDIGRLRIGRLLVDPAVTGRRHLLSIDSRARIADGRAEVGLALGTVAAAGLPGGDRLVLRLDAVPAANRLDIDVALRGPGNGFLAGMIGIDQPIAARLEGRGDWTNWQGRARALLGGRGLADLALSAQDGTFTVRGPLRPGLLVEGPVERLAGPLAQVNLVTSFENRRADVRLRLRSAALAVAAEGLVDLGRNRFENLRVAARLIQPGVIAPDLSGRDVRIALVLNGAFATPGVAYDLRAARLTFDTTTVEGLRAVGSARVRAGDMIVPVSAQATRITGFDAIAGGTITNVRLDGEIGIAGTRLVSDNLRIRSDRIDATLALAFDLSSGQYLVGIQGRVDNYLVDGVGLFDITANLDMVSESGGFGLRGRVAARTRRIDNETVAGLLGGPGTITANVAVDSSGLIRIGDVRLASPLLRVTSGSGVYRPDGTVDFRLAGVSDSYGPLTVAVTGTPASPNVRLTAASPGFGVGLRDVEATVRSAAGGWSIEATGESDYGPFTADVVIASDSGPLTVAINRLTFAGIDFQGRIVQTAAGPFAGTLTLVGQGLDGTVQLSAAGAYQRIDIAAAANGARTPGDIPITIQRGVVRATAILTPTPSIVGDAQVAGLSSGNLSIARARLRLDYQGGTGRAQLFAEGRSGVPFRVAVNAALAPEVIRAAMQGQVNNIPFRFAEPAEIRREAAGWRLQPVTVGLQQGRIRLAGLWGEDLVVQSRIDSLDLSLLNAFSPELGLGGRATGSLDFAQPGDGSFPRAEARLNIANFTRTGLATRSVPVDLALAGSLRPEGGRLATVIRRGGSVIGRVQATLQPLPPGQGSWMTRLLAAPFSGGIRYNGPADVPMSFANLAGHQLSGPIVIAADFGGRLDDPRFVGLVRANNLTYVNEQYGTRVTNLALNGRFDASRLEITQLSGRAGDGTVTGRGSVGLAAAAGFPIDVRLQFENAQLARSDDIGATATGTIAVVNGPAGARISGDISLAEARYRFVRQAAAEVRDLAGVRRRGEPIAPPDAQQADNAVPSIWELDLRVRANNQIFVSGMGLDSEWSADLRVQGTTATPRIIGDLDLIRGELSLAGRRFDVRRGNVTFTGDRPPNPQIEIEAVSDIDGIEVAIVVTGSSTNPQIAFTSTPNLPQEEVMSRILFGSSVTEISALQAVQLAASLNTLRGGGGGLNPLGQLRSAAGFTSIRILGADDTTGRGTAVAAGMYLSDDIFIELITDARGFTAMQLEIALSRTLSLLSQFGSTSATNVNLRYSRDY
ncbi:translocation/assembly module TamB domain-containing protein [Sphingosinicella sp. CPCC 101087]|uniref:translocation/assembly module TamB domain-containing protein n=1 Tax=Sphingosinicella sp. CPCC 101087 TaxID=2497754 RepID=UPI00101E0AAF|nr:translocation/assembly module TamB domain-containing protein [Sphingosinicella sp. CPCC 101087]